MKKVWNAYHWGSSSTWKETNAVVYTGNIVDKGTEIIGEEAYTVQGDNETNYSTGKVGDKYYEYKRNRIETYIYKNFQCN